MENRNLKISRKQFDQMHSLMRLMPVMTDKVTQPYKTITPEELTYQQMQVLMYIQAKPDSRMIDLAQCLHMKKQQLSPICAYLESAGYIARTEDSKDRRSTSVSLTAEGRKMLKAIDRNIVSSLKPSFDRLSEKEQAEIARLADELAALLEKM